MVVEVVRSSEFWIFFKVKPTEYPDIRPLCKASEKEGCQDKCIRFYGTRLGVQFWMYWVLSDRFPNRDVGKIDMKSGSEV